MEYEYGNKAIPTVKAPQPLADAINTHSEQLDKLSTLIVELQDRLRPIRNTTPEDDAREAEALRGGSPLFNQLTDQTSTVKNLQYRIQVMLSDLEI